MAAEEFDIGKECVVDSLEQDEDDGHHYPSEDSKVFEGGSGDAAQCGAMDVESRCWLEKIDLELLLASCGHCLG